MQYLKKYQLMVLMMLGPLFLVAQKETTHSFSVPLSDPNAVGQLKVSLHNGSISVEGYSGKEVMVTMVIHEKEQPTSGTKSGLKRIPNTSRDFSVTEEGNVVRISAGNKKRTNFEVKVPEDFSLSVSTHHNGDIKVSNLNGVFELSGHHGGIELFDVEGSAIADTHHGDITATFKAIKQNTPMAFSTYHGDIDISYPAQVNASTKIRSERGDIYTDFELETKNSFKTQRIESKSKTKIAINEWIYAKIGNGGAEYMFTTHHGDVILRKNN